MLALVLAVVVLVLAVACMYWQGRVSPIQCDWLWPPQSII
jgi:hypothetical protein